MEDSKDKCTDKEEEDIIDKNMMKIINNLDNKEDVWESFQECFLLY